MAALPRPTSLWERLWRIALYVSVAALPMAVAVALGPDRDVSLDLLGRCAAMLAFGVVSVQLILASRWHWIEHPFGLDRIYGFHRAMGVVAVGLLLTHPTLMALGGDGLELFTDLRAPWYIWVGKGTLLVVVLLVLAALFRLTFRIEFEVWRRMHGIVGPAVLVAALVHAFLAGTDVQGFVPQAMFVVYAAAAITSSGVARWRPRRRYAVHSVRAETSAAATVTLTPPAGGEVPPYLPGQFHFLTFLSGSGLPREEHPFTISSDPTDRAAIASTIKASGDFTARLGALQPGDSALVSGPYGRFSCQLHPRETQLVMIAAGIGITPLMSMIRHLRSSGQDRDVLLLYGNRTEADIVFREELAELEARGSLRLRVVHVLSKPSAEWSGEKGRLSGETLRRLCGDITGKGFYVCGPVGMLSDTVHALRGLGVPSWRLHYERFAL